MSVIATLPLAIPAASTAKQESQRTQSLNPSPTGRPKSYRRYGSVNGIAWPTTMRRAIAAQVSASRKSKACAPNVHDVRDLGDRIVTIDRNEGRHGDRFDVGGGIKMGGRHWRSAAQRGGAPRDGGYCDLSVVADGKYW
jgi:hypothetical protein